ncbi:MAG: RagB/SusD family nutrient uptake outer membrane protein [Tannerellaceae bacterium]|jgi:hypothetical protein|nr:RagB/SusD family nutrient uptake outer membrane protein [Tannerellaceae bacterium]
MKKIKSTIVFGALLGLAVMLLIGACSPEPTYYSQSTPELFFDTKTKVYQRFGRPFTHWAYHVGGTGQSRSTFYILQEFTTDEMLNPKRYNDWYDGGMYMRYYWHDFSPAYNDAFREVWNGFAQGISMTWSAKEDIENYVDFEALGFSAEEQGAISAQLSALVAYFYWMGLDHFGGVPLYTSNNEPLRERATDVETFKFIESLLLESLEKIPAKAALGAKETGGITKGAVAAMLMRLYFNAESYIREDHYTEAAKYAQDIISGVYGPYELENDWTDIWGFDNDLSPEIIWTVPSENTLSERSSHTHSSPYGMQSYFDNPTVGDTNNGYCLTPSMDVEGKSLMEGSINPSTKIGTFRLGSPFAKFHATDVRKQLYAYGPASKQRKGMFLFGKLINPVNGKASMGGGRQIPGDQVAELVDQIGRLTIMKDVDGNPLMADHLKEGIEWAEEASGVRVTKMSPTPNAADNALKGNPDIPVIRLAEVYYTLAECKMRAGDKAGAADLINKVKARYYEGGANPDPVTSANLDEYRMLDEWMVEFLGEGRRRQDLIRWNKFNDAWWDHAPSEAYKNRFPIPQTVLATNPLLEQNPGYTK